MCLAAREHYLTNRRRAFKDPFPVNRGRSILLVQLEFDDQESLDRALESRERAAAREDFKRFPAYEGSVTHQAMAGVVAWRNDA